MFSTNTNQSTGHSTLNRELSQILEIEIAKLPADYRIVFTLRELSGLSVAETADALHLTESCVKVRLNKARTMLRQQLYLPENIFEFNLVYCDRIVEQVMYRIQAIGT